MRTILALLLTSLSLIAADVKLVWDGCPIADMAAGYRLYAAKGITINLTNFNLVTVTTNTTATVTNLTPGAWTFYATGFQLLTTNWITLSNNIYVTNSVTYTNESKPSNFAVNPPSAVTIKWICVLVPENK